MSKSKEFEMEVTHTIYSKSGYYYELSPDADTGACVEFRYYDDIKDKEPMHRIIIPFEMIDSLISALRAQKEQISLSK